MSEQSGKNKSGPSGAQPANLQCKDLHEYLKTRTPQMLESLYNHSTICLAVYRDLPELGRHYVIRLLFVEQPVPQAVVASWGSQTFSKEHTEVCDSLSELSVWKEAAIPGGLPGWTLSSSFKRNLKVALLGGGRPWSMSGTLEKDAHSRDAAFLDSYALERWECVLHYMVGSQQTEGISVDAVRILLHAGLMARDTEDGSTVITRAGFQFLLLGTGRQVWLFLLHYLHTAGQRGLDPAHCLAFLFQLSFSTLGKDYSTDGMSNNMLVFLQHLREFGLVYQRKRKAGRFYPTRLALNIACARGTPTTALTATSSAPSPSGYIVVETNYRVYAYTASGLQVALLGLFTELLYRFPNLVVGVLTRESVRQALRGGITAKQMIDYLEQHSHPRTMSTECYAQTPSPVPPTIVDQIKLWENERNRFTYTEGVVYNQFLSQADYVILKEHARSLGVLVWENGRTRTAVVTKSGHDDVKKFWKRYSKSS